MPRSATQYAEIRDDTRRLLLEAATKVFVRMGFAAARMADVAREAGLSHGLAYHYFPNKDAVFVAVVEATMEGANHIASGALGGRQPAITRLRQFCERMLRGAQENPTYPLIMLQASSSAAIPKEARLALRRLSRHIAAALAKLIREAQRAGDVGGGDSNMLARTLLATISGLAVSRGPNSGALPPVDIVLRLLDPSRSQKSGDRGR
jgi:AcrR family transcriptional regulator